MRYDITPVGKPRMTHRDRRGDKRPAVAKYHAFKDEVRLKKVKLAYWGEHYIFSIPMPKSWSKTKKMMHYGTPHMQTPDTDNLVKALLDAVFDDDSKVWDFRATKLWAYEGEIEVLKLKV